MSGSGSIGARSDINRLHAGATGMARSSRDALDSALLAAWQAGQLLDAERKRIRRICVSDFSRHSRAQPGTASTPNGKQSPGLAEGFDNSISSTVDPCIASTAARNSPDKFGHVSMILDSPN